jgi:hypothetical protein
LPGVISEELHMRIRVPGRVIAVLAILTATLCLLPVSAKVAVAIPIGWIDIGPPYPPPAGDNDGVVLKALSTPSTPVLRAGTTGSVPTLAKGRNDFGRVRLILSVTKLDYWLFWLR